MRRSACIGVLLALVLLGPTLASAQPGAGGDTARSEDGFRAEIAMLRRMNQVVWPILVAAAPRCERLGLAGATIGVAAVNLTSFPPERRAWAREQLGLGLRPRVLFVPDGTPAHGAGLREGDAILAVNGAAIPESDDAPGEINQRAKDAIRVDAPIRFTVARAAGRADLSIRPVTVCRLAIIGTDSAEIEATFKGDRAMVSRGLGHFATADRDVAIILAHALAHVILDAETGSSTLRFNNAGTPDLERAADTLSLELAGAAGFAVDGAAALWERLQQASPAPTRTSLAALHPITPERLAALRAAAAQGPGPTPGSALAGRREPATPSR